MREYNYLPLSVVNKYEPEAKRLEVSKVARSRTGFLAAYKRAGGSKSKLSDYWRRKRNGFIARHLVQYKKNPTYRRKLALIMWAYMP